MTFIQKIEISKLNSIAKDLRRKIIINSAKNKIPHLGSCLSCLEILIYLYWCQLEIDPKDPYNFLRDRFILSKGHAAPALYQVLALRGFFDSDELESYGQNGSFFHEHPPKPGYIPGIEAATGSLGHGFPMSLGMAIASKVSQKEFICYSLLSDGECNEGTIWEAAMMASSLNLSNLVAIIDFNKWQATGRSKEILKIDPLVEKWRTFGWSAYEIDGNSFDELKSVFEKVKLEKKKPSVIIANTIKGKGVSFMEDDNNWHYRTPNPDELNAALKELI